MQFNLIRVAIVLYVGALPGCWRQASVEASRPIPLKDALAILQQDLREVAPVTLSDVGGVGNGESRVINEIGVEQCKQDTANPLMPILNGPLSLQLSGQFQVGGQLGFVVSTPPALSAQASVQAGVGQTIAVPISFISLSGLANFHFGQDTANFSNVPDSFKTDHIKELLKVRERIVNLSKKLMDSYAETLRPHCAEIRARTLNTASLITIPNPTPAPGPSPTSVHPLPGLAPGAHPLPGPAVGAEPYRPHSGTINIPPLEK